MATATVYRIQPAGFGILGHYSARSTGDEDCGPHVFVSLLDAARGVLGWMDDDWQPELVTIRCESAALEDNEDYEGMVLRDGAGDIMARQPFPDWDALRDWAFDVRHAASATARRALRPCLGVLVGLCVVAVSPVAADVYRCPRIASGAGSEGRGGTQYQNTPCPGRDDAPIIVTAPRAPTPPTLAAPPAPAPLPPPPATGSLSSAGPPALGPAPVPPDQSLPRTRSGVRGRLLDRGPERALNAMQGPADPPQPLTMHDEARLHRGMSPDAVRQAVGPPAGVRGPTRVVHTTRTRGGSIGVESEHVVWEYPRSQQTWAVRLLFVDGALRDWERLP